MNEDLLGISDIARLAGVSRQVASNWRSRYDDFPDPRARLGAGPAFSKREIEMWLRKRGKPMGEEPVSADQKRRARVLRHFLYCDVPLVRDFLAEVEGGIYAERDFRTTTEGAKKMGGGLSVGPVALSGSGEHATTTEAATRVRQVMASEFDRLHNRLADEGMIQDLTAFDEAIWDQVQVGELVEVPVMVRLPGLLQFMQMLSDYMRLAPRMQAAGVATGIPPEQQAALQFFAEMGGGSTQGALSVIATATGNTRVKFLCRLNREHIRIEGEAIEGEATVLAKVQRKMRRGESVPAVDIPMLRNLTGKKQREFMKLFGQPDIEGMHFAESDVAYPGAVLTALALYR
jgi:hypothetical protein